MNSETMRILTVNHESFPLRQTFTISRGSKTASDVIVVELIEGESKGWGECLPYARYDESIESVQTQIESIRGDICNGMNRNELQSALPPGAARNAMDCALWDLEAKLSGRRVWELAGIPAPQPVATAYTLGIDSVEAMAAAAKRHAARPLLKLKLGAEGALERVRAIRQAAPTTRMIIDANEAWSIDALRELLPELKELGIEMVEQPLPAGDDAALENLERILPIGADESCHLGDDLPTLRRRYDVINIKLDKTGGLTEALRLRQQAQAAGLKIMVGCMVATSLSMAPATLLGHDASFVDLDGPLLMASDREYGLKYLNGNVHPPDPMLWG